eukprot:1152146-Rhodomonas_salina.2
MCCLGDDGQTIYAGVCAACRLGKPGRDIGAYWSSIPRHPLPYESNRNRSGVLSLARSLRVQYLHARAERPVAVNLRLAVRAQDMTPLTAAAGRVWEALSAAVRLYRYPPGYCAP